MFVFVVIFLVCFFPQRVWGGGGGGDLHQCGKIISEEKKIIQSVPGKNKTKKQQQKCVNSDTKDFKFTLYT